MPVQKDIEKCSLSNVFSNKITANHLNIRQEGTDNTVNRGTDFNHKLLG